MYTSVNSRGKGVVSKVLLALEKWAADLSYTKCILETGIKQHEAIGLYIKNGYKLILNYGHYIKIKESICFEKSI